MSAAEERAKRAAYMREYLQRPAVRAKELERRRAARRANPEKYRQQERASKKRNKPALLARKKRYRQQAADKIRAYNAAYSAANVGKMREWRSKWELQNPASLPRRKRERRMAEARATPTWADREAIAAVYDQRARISRETGVEHHVDHILPLRGARVCGLHVHGNLRVIPAADNYAKSNRVA